MFLFFEIVGTFDVPQYTVSCLYRKYLMKGISIHYGQCSSQPQVFNDHNQQHLTRNLYSNTQVILVQIRSPFKAASTMSDEYSLSLEDQPGYSCSYHNTGYRTSLEIITDWILVKWQHIELSNKIHLFENDGRVQV